MYWFCQYVTQNGRIICYLLTTVNEQEKEVEPVPRSAAPSRAEVVSTQNTEFTQTEPGLNTEHLDTDLTMKSQLPGSFPSDPSPWTSEEKLQVSRRITFPTVRSYTNEDDVDADVLFFMALWLCSGELRSVYQLSVQRRHGCTRASKEGQQEASRQNEVKPQG